MIDSSGSIHEIYGRQMQLVKDLIMMLPVGQDSTNVAAIQYAGIVGILKSFMSYVSPIGAL